MISQLYPCFRHWSEVGTVWIVSDTHFGDAALRAGMPSRPSDEELVKRINSFVGKKDTLIHLGDVGDVEMMKKVKGRKILIMGNHDAGATNYEEVFDEIYSGALFIGEKIVLSHEPINIPFAMNLHGHIHSKNHKNDATHFNACVDVTDYTPINFNQFVKKGYFSKIASIHRVTIDKATLRKKKRGGPIK